MHSTIVKSAGSLWARLALCAGLTCAASSGVSAEGEALPAALEAPPAVAAQPSAAPVAGPAPVAPPALSAAQEEAAKRAAQEEQARTSLTGTKWSIVWNGGAGEAAAKPIKDTISFEGRQIVSERLVKAGYPASNYSLTLSPDGTIIWETMQTKEGEGVAFWRGEVQGDTMRGVLSKHPVEGASEDYTISGKRVGSRPADEKPAASKPFQEKPAAPAPAVAAPAASSEASSGENVKTESPKKKRRLW